MSFVKKIRIKNFKGLEDVEIEMNQLTFLFGPNSSGKSSFIKAMMFLAKNILPLNTGQTIYKVSETLDLGTYKDIVTDNDKNKDIVFEFDLVGGFKFPVINVLENGDSHFNQFKKNNFFKEFDKLIELIKSNDKYLKRIINEFDFNITFRIEFTDDPKGNNLLTLSIKNNIENSRYDFIYRYNNKGLFQNANEYDAQCPSFNFSGNKFISALFNSYFLEISNEFPISLHDHFFSTFENTVLKYDNFTPDSEEFPIELIFGDFLKEWIKLSQAEKISVYYEVLKFLYISQRLVPSILKSFIAFKHIPTTRQIPQKVYLLESNNFNKNDYYGILSDLTSETGAIEKVFEETKSKKLNDISYNNILDKIKKGNFFIEKSNNNINKKRKVKSKTLIKSDEKQKDYFKNYLKTNHFIINNQLFKFGFNHFYIIDIQNDVGRIYLIGKNNMKTYMADSSSGFIQVFPIIVSCCLLQKYYNHQLSLLKSLKDIGYIGRDFEVKINSIEYLANENLTLPYSINFITEYSTLMIEQPELHLHPKLQSKLAELFNETLSNMDELNSLIIETHSEHLIRKIQVLIARGELDRSKLSVQYFNNENGITKVETMEIDEHGLFVKDWPNGFFDDSVNLTMELYEAIREIKKRKN